jgi:hypothetical protein
MGPEAERVLHGPPDPIIISFTQDKSGHSWTENLKLSSKNTKTI